MPANIYANALVHAFLGEINLGSDSLKMALLDSGYTPNLVTDDDFSDIRIHEVTGAGYTEGGETLSSTSVVLTAADSWGVTWAADTPYTYGTVVIPPTPNGLLYRCVLAGTSDAGAPPFPTVAGQTVPDNSTVWACLGDAINIFTSDAVLWSTLTTSASYAAIYDAQSGTYTSEPLLILETFTATQNPSGVPFQVAPDPVLGWWYWSPPS